MARNIKSIIKFTEKQTLEFLDSLNHPKNAKNRDKTIARALGTKFNVL